MPLDESLVYNQLLDINKKLGELGEKTECLPDLNTSVTRLEQQFHDHLKAAHRKPPSARAQGGIIAGLLAAIAAISVAVAELTKLIGR